MVANGDVLEFTLRSEFGSPGNQGLNVFQYRVETTETALLYQIGQELGDLVYETILNGDFRNVISTEVNYMSFAWKNLTEPLEIFEGTPTTPLQGAISGDCLPPYAAWGFKLTRTNALTRNGAKRFWGVPEGLQANGLPTGLAIVNLPLIAENLATVIPFDLTDWGFLEGTLVPAIVRKDETGAMTASQDVSTAQFRSITTQNTRKYGRGM